MPVWLAALLAALAAKRTEWRKADSAVLALAPLLGTAIVIIGAAVTLLVVASLSPSFVNSTAQTSSAIANADWGNGTANALNGPMAMLVSIGGMFALVAVVLGAIAIKKSKGG